MSGQDRQFQLTKAAATDVDSIGQYTRDTWGHRQAAVYLTELDAAFRLLADNPQSGKLRSDLGQKILSLHVKRHMIFFRRQETKDVEILRILHEAMDYSRHL